MIMKTIILFFFLINNVFCQEEYITLTENNTIHLDKSINEEVISKIIYQMSINNEQTIYIYINSPGGEVKWGNHLIDTIEYYSKQKNIVCISSYAASMAFAILQKCPYRYGTKHSTFMQHSITTNIKGNKIKMSNYITYLDQLD